MADEITQCNKVLDDSNAVTQYDFTYSVVDGEKTNNFCVTILASEMTDPDDADEAKTKANVKAAAIKAAWVAADVTTSEAVASVVGSVTL